jgi:hypothetical protein
MSGRSNWGKSTTLITAMSYLRIDGFKVLTDDWAVVSEKKKTIFCMDNVSTLRDVILHELPRVFPSMWIKELTEKFLHNPFGESRPALNTGVAFGEDNVKYSGYLRGVVTLHTTPLFNGSLYIDFTGKEDRKRIAAELANHANHCPDISQFTLGRSLKDRYEEILNSCFLASLFTRAIDKKRKEQMEWLVGWIRDVTSYL